MSGNQSGPVRPKEILTVLGRVLLGGVFLYLGAVKAMEPVEFLKQVRQFGVVQAPWWLNFTAATLPWCEIVCGVLLLLGVAVRGTALVAFGLLVPFSGLILWRALELQAAGGGPLCAIRFDCGCGVGEVLACRKLTENALLVAVSVGLIFSRVDRFCLRHALRPTSRPQP